MFFIPKSIISYYLVVNLLFILFVVKIMANALNNWKVEIVNSFIKFRGQRVSNGPIEGRNSLIKKILKIANGYSNFKRFRNRVMYCLNRYASHSFKKY